MGQRVAQNCILECLITNSVITENDSIMIHNCKHLKCTGISDQKETVNVIAVRTI